MPWIPPRVRRISVALPEVIPASSATSLTVASEIGDVVDLVRGAVTGVEGGALAASASDSIVSVSLSFIGSSLQCPSSGTDAGAPPAPRGPRTAFLGGTRSRGEPKRQGPRPASRVCPVAPSKATGDRRMALEGRPGRKRGLDERQTRSQAPACGPRNAPHGQLIPAGNARLIDGENRAKEERSWTCTKSSLAGSRGRSICPRSCGSRAFGCRRHEGRASCG